MIQRLALLGATGSIGASTVEVVRHHPDRLSIATLGALGRNPEELLALAREFRPLLLAVVDPAVARYVRRAPSSAWRTTSQTQSTRSGKR